PTRPRPGGPPERSRRTTSTSAPWWRSRLDPERSRVSRRSPVESRFDLARSKALADEAALHWGLERGPPFGLAQFSSVAPAGHAVVKVAWHGDDESLHEADALRLWNGDGAVRLLDTFGRAILEERAVPGDDLAAVPEADATSIAVDVASSLWRRARPPFRPV